MSEIANLIVQMIGSIGFPIVMCLLIFKYMQEQQKTNAEQIQKLNETLINNTNALERLSDKLGGE